MGESDSAAASAIRPRTLLRAAAARRLMMRLCGIPVSRATWYRWVTLGRVPSVIVDGRRYLVRERVELAARDFIASGHGGTHGSPGSSS
ncbi:MAG: hypothetical protein ACRD4Q_01715 [Candidatus Acidiferrales bacterium]